MTIAQNECRIKALVKELYELTDFEGVLTASLEQGHITSSDILHMADCYLPPYGEEDFTDDRCVEVIEHSLETCLEGLDGVERINQRLSRLPQVSDVMGVIKKFYDDDEILGTFDSSDLFDAVEGSWEMDDHDEELRKIYEYDLDEAIYYMEDEEQRTLVDVLENGYPDELWNLMADYGMCSNYDFEGIVRALKKFIWKLEQSNYNKEIKAFDTEEYHNGDKLVIYKKKV